MEWTLYWILKLDDIRAYFERSVMLSFIPGITILILLILVIIAVGVSSGSSTDRAFSAMVFARKKLIGCVATLCLFTIIAAGIIHTLLPSTSNENERFK